MDQQSSLYTLNGHEAGVNTIAYSNTEKQFLLSGGDDFLVILWDLQTKQLIKKFNFHKENVSDVIFFSSIDFFASLSEDGIIALYNLNE